MLRPGARRDLMLGRVLTRRSPATTRAWKAPCRPWPTRGAPGALAVGGRRGLGAPGQDPFARGPA
eukprot:7356194-Lingulodinium_polyedra.AAC.1